ncbi:MAG: outer membrane protein transport protein [Gammaproteobacteria bacterium]|nr:outer membrane protein transport protein [Gammaproteobacteria bacterium]
MRNTFVTGALVLCLSPGSAWASGFALIETNAAGQGNAYAGAAAYTNDASTIFFNPAGLTFLQDDHIVLASHLIMPKSDFTNKGSTAAAILGGGPLTGPDDDGGFNAFVPNFYWVKTIDESMKIGLGVNTPFGLATKYDDNWVGRYHAVESDLKTINFNPSIGYRINDKLSVGGGVNLILADVILSSAIDFGAICVASLGPAACAGLGALPQQADGFADLEGDNFDDIGLGFNFGFIYQLSDRTRLGIAYRSEIDVEVDGEADFRVPASTSFVLSSNLFVDTGLSADVTLPASLSFSVSHRKEKITYLADITFTGWSSFDELRIVYDNPVQPDSVTTESWEDSFRYSFGIDYQYSDRIILRTGLAHDNSPVPSAERRTARLPGDHRTWISFGMGYQYSKELSFDVGYSHLFIKGAEIDNEFESSVPTLAATLTGEYDATVDIFSAQLNWRY